MIRIDKIRFGTGYRMWATHETAYGLEMDTGHGLLICVVFELVHFFTCITIVLYYYVLLPFCGE